LWRPQRCWWAHGQYGSKNSEAGLAETLLYLENTFGKNTDGTLKIQLSRDELSSMIGTATESCIRQTLKKWFYRPNWKKNNIERLGQTKKIRLTTFIHY
jgi:hypothetical protein